ncbi:MAG: amidohydrolase [Hyphomicrobiaceae bacterium]
MGQLLYRSGIAGLALLTLLGTGLAGGFPCRAQSSTILINGKILTLDERSSIAEALAFSGEKIVAVGANSDVLAYRRVGTRIVDLGGRTVIPGLIDSHIHAIRAGLTFETEVSWIGATSIAEALGRIRRAALTRKPGDWIVVAGGWTPAQFTEHRRPTEDEVASAAPSHPVYIQFFYRAVLLTSIARRKLGIVSDGDLPANASFETSADGTPTGWIKGNGAAVIAIFSRLPRPTLAESVRGTQRFMGELNRLGITGVIDPGGYNLSPEDYEALFRLSAADGLGVRVAFSICAPRRGSELEDLQTLTRFLPMGFANGMLRFNGIGERVTWDMNNNDDPTQDQKDAYYRIARWAAGRGLTLTMHWNNDRSVHQLLEIFERVDREVPLRNLRWSIAHLHDATQASLERMNAMGIGWLMQNGLYFAAPYYLAGRGKAVSRMPPIKTALQLGLKVGGGTDAHRVMSYNPFVSLRWMIDGRTVDGLPTRGRSELLSREEALRIYTSGSAWFAFAENERGSLTPGRLADLAVLDRDYLTIPTGDIAALQSVLTVVGGRVVHAAGPFSDVLKQAAP